MGATIAGGYLVYTGFAGLKLFGSVETKTKIDLAPIVYDSLTGKYSVWQRGYSFPTSPGSGLQIPKIPGLVLQITFPGPNDEWEDAKEIRIRIQNTAKVESKEAYVGVVAVYFGANPTSGWIEWCFTRPTGLIPAIDSAQAVTVTLKSSEMGYTLQHPRTFTRPEPPSGIAFHLAGDDFPNIGLIVTLYDDWTGNKIYDSAKTLVRVNDSLRKRVEIVGALPEVKWFV